MADFKKVFPKVLSNEGANTLTGGFQKWPTDNGNWTGGQVGVGQLVGTKYGITAPEVSKLLGRTATENDIKALSLDNALKIYKARYWDVIRGDEINSDEIAYEIVDMAVNAGVGTVKIAYRVAGLPEQTHMTQELLDVLNNKS